jgi:hypothetical protein
VLLELELEKLLLAPTTPDADVDAGIAKASAATVSLIEPPSVSGKSLSSVIVESDESDSASCFLSSSVTGSIFSIIASSR